MDKADISKRFGVPATTLIKWQKTRPDYYEYLSLAPILLDALPNNTLLALFEATKAKQVQQLLGLDSSFSKDIGITASTVSDWLASGKVPLYVGLLSGAVISKLTALLNANNVTITTLLQSELDIVDFVFIWRHRPHMIAFMLKAIQP